jgi:hypothetical protein
MGQKVISPNLLKLMSQDDRKQFGKAGLTPEEASDKADKRAEKEDHEGFLNYCKLKGIERIHSRMDKTPTIKEGWPDFTCFFEGKTVFFEFKKTSKLKPKQEAQIGLLRELGFTVHVVYSLDAAIKLVRTEFNL